MSDAITCDIPHLVRPLAMGVVIMPPAADRTMEPMKSSAADIDYARVINSTRLELESAGNPAYVVVILDASGEAHLAPMVFSTIGPASDHAQRLAPALGEGERIVVVSRSAAGRRAMFTILDPRTLRKLHQRPEMIEQTFAESDGPL